MTKRRGNNEGTITKRNDGRWEAKISLPGGKRKSFYGKTRNEVRLQLQESLHDVQKGIIPSDDRQTVEQFLRNWLDVRTKTKQIGGSTARIYYYSFLRIYKHLGSIPLGKLTAQRVQQVYLLMLESGIAPYTLHITHVVFKAAFKDAVKLGVVTKNIFDSIVAPKKVVKEMMVFTLEQVQTFVKGIKGHRLEALYLLVLSTGLRAGEVFALEWRDIDLERKIVTVRLGFHQEMEGYVLSLPKTPHARRTIAITQSVVDALLVHRTLQNEEKELLKNIWCKDLDLVFPSTVGGRVWFEYFCTKTFRPLLRTLQLPEIRFHDLRHTAATLLLSRGVNVKVVSEMLGHSNVTITLRTYAHILPHMQEQAAKVMEDILTTE